VGGGVILLLRSPPAHYRKIMARYQQSRSWVFTLNNPTAAEVDDIKDMPKHGYDYLCFQREVGEDAKTPHLQGLLVLPRKATLSKLKKIIPRAHWERMMGTFDQARAYCTKLDTRAPGTEPVELGVASEQGQGNRNDINKMMAEIKEGNYSEVDLANKYESTYLRAYKGVQHLIQLQKEANPAPYVRKPSPICWVFFGTTGTGKTYRCESVAIQQKKSMCILSMQQLKAGWYSGYAGEEIVLLDDFRGDCMKPHELLNLLDNKTQIVPTKGTTTKFKPNWIFITSSDHPINW